MEPSFEKLLALLAEGRVDFIVVGGVAVLLHGYVRLTEDVDILVAADRDNLERLLAALGGYGEGFARELTLDDFADEEGAVRLVEESEQAQLDIFTRMRGQHYADLRADAVPFALGAQTIYYASRAALLRLKGASQREKDQLDVLALRRLGGDA